MQMLTQPPSLFSKMALLTNKLVRDMEGVEEKNARPTKKKVFACLRLLGTNFKVFPSIKNNFPLNSSYYNGL